MGLSHTTEEPRYDSVERLSDIVEVRRYHPRLVAETRVAASGSEDASREGFRVVAGYIFGANKGRKKIDMTTPVEIYLAGQALPVEESENNGMTLMRFFMPSSYQLADLPEPNDSRVSLVELPAVTVAVLRFSGVSDRVNAEQVAALRAALADSRWKVSGPPTGYYYNPPWTLPYLRRNEVIIPVSE